MATHLENTEKSIVKLSRLAQNGLPIHCAAELDRSEVKFVKPPALRQAECLRQRQQLSAR